MSNVQPLKSLPNENGYLSDGSWCSDFSDISDGSNMPISENYAKEIEDNNINENFEANLYANIPPLRTIADQDQLESKSAINAPGTEISERKVGAIPKTAFSYISHELNQNFKHNLLSKDTRKNTKPLDDENMKYQSDNAPPRAVNTDTLLSKNIQSCVENHSKPVKKEMESNQTNIVTFPQKNINKLKPEAFSFLCNIKEKSTTKNFGKEIKQNLPRGSIVKETKNSDPPEKSINCNENNKYESIAPEPTTSFSYDIDNNFKHALDPTLVSLPFQNNSIKTVEMNNKLIEKPPLPDRPPPVFQYPPEIFSREVSGTQIINKPEEHKLTLPTSSVPMIPNTGTIFPGTINTTDLHTQVPVPLDQEKKSRPKPEIYMSGRPSDASTKSREKLDNTKYPKNSSPTLIDYDSCSLKNISERPLPPLPISPLSTMNQNSSDISESKNIETYIRTEIADTLISGTETTSWPNIINSNLIKNETAQVSQDKLLKDQPSKNQSKQNLEYKPIKRLDVISQQTNVSSQTFHFQHEISAALKTRFPSEFSKKAVNVSYEVPKNRSDLSDSISKVVSPVRKTSDIEEVQEAIERPCLPEKLKTTQKSLSCTSLVKTVRDIGFTLWSDKEKRRIEGRNSTEFTFNNFADEIRPSKDQSSPILVDKDLPLKGVPFHEESIGCNPNQEKPIASFAWYHPLNARDAQCRLLALGEDGSFLIRPSSQATAAIPYTACVVFRGRVFNLHIRHKAKGQYALGKEKPGEKTFTSISDLIKYHQEIPIEIRPTSRTSTSEECFHVYLKITPPKV